MSKIQSCSNPVSPPYLFQSSHGIWYARIVVPVDLRSSLGQRELRKSLATKDRLEAARKSWQVLSQLRSVADGDTQESTDMGHTQACTQEALRPTKVSAPTITTQSNNSHPKLPRLSQIVEEFCQEKRTQGAWSPHSEQVNCQTFKDMISL